MSSQSRGKRNRSLRLHAVLLPPAACGLRPDANRIHATVKWLRRNVGRSADVALILGSGLSGLKLGLENVREVPYFRIPNFPLPTVVGHGGKMLCGHAPESEMHVAVFCGRWHMYEGYPLHEVVFPVRVLARWGVKILIVTNAAGGANPSFAPGDLMLIRDHINLLGANPLTGPNLDEIGPRFPDMTEAYDGELRRIAKRCARRLGIALKEGVYLATQGPNYETPAEVRMMRKLGADAIGMSTVPEVIAARHAGMRILGISMISNKAAGLKKGTLNHEEVIRTGKRMEKILGKLLAAILSSQEVQAVSGQRAEGSGQKAEGIGQWAAGSLER